MMEVTCDSLNAASGKCGNLTEADNIFQVTCNSFLAACVKSGDMLKAEFMFPDVALSVTN